MARHKATRRAVESGAKVCLEFTVLTLTSSHECDSNNSQKMARASLIVITDMMFDVERGGAKSDRQRHAAAVKVEEPSRLLR
jgi:hypothetical protein